MIRIAGLGSDKAGEDAVDWLHITMDPEDAEQMDDLVQSLRRDGYVTQPLPDGLGLHAWLPKRGMEEKEGQARVDALVENNSAGQGVLASPISWRLNSARLELVTPIGLRITLSHDESRILQVAVRAKGSLVSRKAIIEALGHNYLDYDERRLEAHISRLRRKIATYSSSGFQIRAVRGHGYLFGPNIQEVGVQE